MAYGDRDRLHADRAARRIQRSYRRYQQKKQADLDRRQQRLEYIKPSILTEAKREELLEQIEKWRSERAVSRPASFHRVGSTDDYSRERCQTKNFTRFIHVDKNLSIATSPPIGHGVGLNNGNACYCT